MKRNPALFAALAFCLGLILYPLPASSQEEAGDELREAPLIMSITVEPGEDRYLIPKISGAGNRAVQAALEGYVLQQIGLADLPLPGGNHVWLAGADEQIKCNGEPRSLEYLQVSVDLIRDDIDNMVEGGDAKLDRLLGLAPCLNEFIDAETLAKVRLLQGIGSLYYRDDEAGASRFYRNALATAAIPWWDDYDPDQFATEFHRLAGELQNWRRDDSPFWIPVHLSLDAQEVRIDGEAGVTRVLPGEHLIQWRDSDGNVEGRLFQVASELSAESIASDIRMMESRGETGIVVLDDEHWRSTLERQDFGALVDRIVMRATMDAFTDGDAGALVSVQPSGPLGLAWRRGADPEFAQLDLSEVTALLPEQETGTSQVQLRRSPVYGAFSLVGGPRWVGTASYGDIELGGHLNPAPGAWIDLTVGLGMTLWEPPEASSRNVLLPIIGLGGRYVFQTPWLLPPGRGLELYLRPYIGGKAQLLVIEDNKVGGGGIFVGGVEIRPSSGGLPSPLWIRIEGFVGGYGALEQAFPTYGVRVGFALHNAWKRTAPEAASN